MATTTTTVYSHITKDPRIRGGKACIEGTRVAVMDVVFFYRRGYAPERIQEEYPLLNLAQVHAALSYYHQRKDEIESLLREEDAFADELDRQWEEYVQRHGGYPPDEPASADRHIARPVGWRLRE